MSREREFGYVIETASGFLHSVEIERPGGNPVVMVTLIRDDALRVTRDFREGTIGDALDQLRGYRLVPVV